MHRKTFQWFKFHLCAQSVRAGTTFFMQWVESSWRAQLSCKFHLRWFPSQNPSDNRQQISITVRVIFLKTDQLINSPSCRITQYFIWGKGCLSQSDRGRGEYMCPNFLSALFWAFPGSPGLDVGSLQDIYCNLQHRKAAEISCEVADAVAEGSLLQTGLNLLWIQFTKRILIFKETQIPAGCLKSEFAGRGCVLFGDKLTQNNSVGHSE